MVVKRIDEDQGTATLKGEPREKLIKARAARKETEGVKPDRPFLYQPDRVRAIYTPKVRNVDKEWITERLQATGQSMRDLAAKMGKQVSGLSLIISGKRGIRAAEVVEMAKHLWVTPEELLPRLGADMSGMHKVDQVPVKGWVDAAGAVHEGGVRGSGTVKAPPDAAPDLWALRVQGGPMEGWVLYIKPADGVTADAVGRLCLVKPMQPALGEMLLRWVRRGYEDGIWNLGGFSGQGQEEEARLVSASPVVWIKQ